MAWAQGDQPAAARYCEEALALSRELGDPEGEAMTLQQLGQVAVQQEDFARARTYLDGALDIATRHGFDGIWALAEWRLGMVALFAKDMRGAGRHIKASLDLSRRQSDEEMVAMSLLMLGNIDLWQGRLKESRAHLRESLELLRVEGSARSIANLLESLAAVAVAQNEGIRALRLGGAAEGLRKQIAVVPSSPFHREISTRLATAKQGKGAIEAWKSGSGLTREEAIAYALEEASAIEADPEDRAESAGRNTGP
jgi:tetratricopeptide (TPR) repeat protein